MVAATTIILDAVILRRDARVGSCAEVGTHAESLGVHVEQFGEPITADVVAIRCAALPEDGDGRLAAVRNQ